MKLKDFKKRMKKGIFSWEEARVVAFGTKPAILKVQLHKWKKAGDLISLKRGLYMFADASPLPPEVAKALYSPCYISLEYALNYYGLIPDIPFAMTLVTTRPTRRFNTLLGQFTYQKIKKEAFLGFDPKTLLAEPEKALVDYLYLNQSRFVANSCFWDEMRWQNLETVKLRKARKFLAGFSSKKLAVLLKSLEGYAKFIKTG